MADIIYNRAIEKNLGEIIYALWELNILKELDSYTTKNHVQYLGMSFFEIAKSALYYDMMSSAAKALELSKYDNPTFWYILKRDKGTIKTLKSYSEKKIKALKILAIKLKDIRDQDLFHLDKRGILYSREIWDKPI